ncbi:hypothetical protein [Dysgonomonas sp.]
MSPPEGEPEPAPVQPVTTYQEPELIPIGVLVEHKTQGCIMRTDEYNESSNTYHCTSQNGNMYLGCFKRNELVIIKDEELKE